VDEPSRWQGVRKIGSDPEAALPDPCPPRIEMVIRIDHDSDSVSARRHRFRLDVVALEQILDSTVRLDLNNPFYFLVSLNDMMIHEIRNHALLLVSLDEEDVRVRSRSGHDQRTSMSCLAAARICPSE
jgi:hypothetical protein